MDFWRKIAFLSKFFQIFFGWVSKFFFDEPPPNVSGFFIEKLDISKLIFFRDSNFSREHLHNDSRLFWILAKLKKIQHVQKSPKSGTHLNAGYVTPHSELVVHFQIRCKKQFFDIFGRKGCSGSTLMFLWNWKLPLFLQNWHFLGFKPCSKLDSKVDL